jgi:hypothetical protein
MNKKPTVYFGFNNQSELKVVMQVREYLKKLDLEVIEYKGGAYSNDILNDRDFYVFIPHFENTSDDIHFLGKGNFSQIDYIQKYRKRLAKILIIRDCEFTGSPDEKIFANELKSIDVYDATNWKTKYGIANLESPMLQLKEFFNPFVEEDKAIVEPKAKNDILDIDIMF